ncbi:RNA methyltransferase [Motilimonas sp. 1_MG-2023]|uniref:RNA methyltransferase n=1 Tax=Motilimonas sp. 1_MG-2023 TaxID=3062672 RepID=UPI0026E48E17|nr:RNA methyltransferase [Motilimonas sp. 1_MG-2023]MDO6526410.1 RNA methyltransferase [Motilimonas sp. 1_MG-2023]
MITKNQIKLINSLAQKKYRKQHGLFIVQGEKNVVELFASNFEIHQVFATESFLDKYQAHLTTTHFVAATSEELAKAGTFSSNNTAIALVKTRQLALPDNNLNELVLALDGVSDPGNLGTLIRLADWYGIKQIVASEDCADVYNPKVISATMGSFCRINVVNTDLVAYLSQQTVPIYGAFLEGENIHQAALSQQGVILLGSESHGIRGSVSNLVSHKITIPSFGLAESLNVAMAGAIILDNFKRL